MSTRILLLNSLFLSLMEIYCPECEWEPPSSATWTCECGHAWHTFDTQGKCPECGKVWRETQCHECYAWAPHHDWYHDLPPVDVDAITEEQGVSAGFTYRCVHKFTKNAQISPRPERPLRSRFRAIYFSVSSGDEEQFVPKGPKKK